MIEQQIANETGMFNQIAVGTGVTLVSVLFAVIVWGVLKEVLTRLDPWLHKPPYAIKSITLIFVLVVGTMITMAVGVTLWSALLVYLGIFEEVEDATYYALVAYTTLGLGDVVPPKEWRLLGGMTGANGFLLFGLMTAMLTDGLRILQRTRFDDL
jgi:hypothetical protein